MARSTFKVLFYVNGSKEKNGIVPIMGRVTINGTVAQFSCKRTIPKELWDAKGNKAKGKSMEARETNHPESQEVVPAVPRVGVHGEVLPQSRFQRKTDRHAHQRQADFLRGRTLFGGT